MLDLGQRTVRSTRAAGALALVIALGAGAAAAPAWRGGDPCALLPARELTRVLGRPFAAPQSNPYPPALHGGVPGTRCMYKSQTGHQTVTFVVYTDASATVARDTLNKLKAFFTPQPASAGVGDDSYLDKYHAIHVRQGAVRYFISTDGGSTAQSKDLGNSVARRL